MIEILAGLAIGMSAAACGAVYADWRVRLRDRADLAAMGKAIEEARAKWLDEMRQYGEAHNSLAAKIADHEDRIGGMSNFIRGGLKK